MFQLYIHGFNNNKFTLDFDMSEQEFKLMKIIDMKKKFLAESK